MRQSRGDLNSCHNSRWSPRARAEAPQNRGRWPGGACRRPRPRVARRTPWASEAWPAPGPAPELGGCPAHAPVLVQLLGREHLLLDAGRWPRGRGLRRSVPSVGLGEQACVGRYVLSARRRPGGRLVHDHCAAIRTVEPEGGGVLSLPGLQRRRRSSNSRTLCWSMSSGCAGARPTSQSGSDGARL